MTNKQISEHEVRIYRAVSRADSWMTAREIAVAADVADRTARAHARTMADVGFLEEAKVFGGYRYRVASNLSSQARDYCGQIEEAMRILGDGDV